MVSSGPNCTGEKCIPPNGELGAGSSTGSPRTRLHISDKPTCSWGLGVCFRVARDPGVSAIDGHQPNRLDQPAEPACIHSVNMIFGAA